MKVAIFRLSLFGINTYVVYDEATKDCAVIDPGMINDHERQAMTDFIEREGLNVTQIINTHLHIDHVAGDRFMAQKYGAGISAHTDDAPLGNSVEQQARMFGLQEDFSNVKITKPIEDGDIIKIGEGELKVIHIPGHSPGSVALYDSKDGFLIAGDIIFQGSVGRTDLPGGSHEQLISGIKNKLLCLPDSTVVYPGHGPATTVGTEKKYNPFLS